MGILRSLSIFVGFENQIAIPDHAVAQDAGDNDHVAQDNGTEDLSRSVILGRCCPFL